MTAQYGRLNNRRIQDCTIPRINDSSGNLQLGHSLSDSGKSFSKVYSTGICRILLSFNPPPHFRAHIRAAARAGETCSIVVYAKIVDRLFAVRTSVVGGEFFKHDHSPKNFKVMLSASHSVRVCRRWPMGLDDEILATKIVDSSPDNHRVKAAQRAMAIVHDATF